MEGRRNMTIEVISRFKEEKLKEMFGIVENAKGSEIQIYAIMSKKNPEEVEIWDVISLSITESLGGKIKKSTSDYILSKSESDIQDFNIENDQADDYLIEKLSDSEVPVLNKILSKMKSVDNSSISFKKLSKSKDLRGFAIIFPKNLIVFNKVTNYKLLSPKKYFYIISSESGEFTDIKDENLLSLPNNIDAILFEEPLYIFNRNNFIQMFKFEEAFDHFITEAMNDLGSIVDDTQSLINDSKSQLRNYKRLASACAGYVNRIKEKGVDLEPIAKEYKLNISFLNRKIVLKDSLLSDILTLLNGQAVRDAIFDDKFLAHEKTKV